MNILVIGSGAREHVLVWKLKQSPDVKEIYCSPGNGGIGQMANLIPSCAENDWGSYADFVRQKKIDLTVVGPEVPLAGGIVDHFRDAGLSIFGPDKTCSQLESSKIFAKRFMKKYGLPTADFEVFSDSGKAMDYIFSLPSYSFPVVVKADGLAAGKGVSVCASKEEAKDAVDSMMVKKVFGKSGENIIIEDCLNGRELSLMALCDGKTIKTLPPARDHKRVFDDDKGPNTGGMGAICPCPLTDAQIREIELKVVQPFMKGIQSEGLDYRGVIYFGLMLTEKGPFVLEFNVRFGDPETQVVLPLIETDLLAAFNAVVNQNLDKHSLGISRDSCVGVVCASGGYPGKFDKGKEIWGLEALWNERDVFVFHAGTDRMDLKFLTNGGRVLTVVGKGGTTREARHKAYGAVFKINFEKMHYRSDIAKNKEVEVTV